jgi:hypothetical protein
MYFGWVFFAFGGFVLLSLNLIFWFYPPDDFPIELWKAEQREKWGFTIFCLCLSIFFCIPAFFLDF